MRSIVGLILPLLVAISCLGASKVRLAEGEYAITAAPKNPGNLGKTIDHWVLSKVGNGEFLLEVTTGGAGVTSVQQSYFHPGFRASSYGMTLTAPDESARVSCDFCAGLIRCKSEYQGRPESFESKTNGPKYAFLPGEFYLLDPAWFLASVIQNEGHDFSRETYSLDSDDAPDYKIVPDDPTIGHFVGVESITSMGKTIQAKKYILSPLGWIVWTTQKDGIVLRIESPENQGKIDLTMFKSVDPKFAPELQ